MNDIVLMNDSKQKTKFSTGTGHIIKICQHQQEFHTWMNNPSIDLKERPLRGSARISENIN